MAGQPEAVLTGGSGMWSAAAVAPTSANASVTGAAAGVQPHFGPIALVLLAVALLFVLDRAGFRFAVTAGRR